VKRETQIVVGARKEGKKEKKERNKNAIRRRRFKKFGFV